jgi:hypothetical protein
MTKTRAIFLERTRRLIACGERLRAVKGVPA